MDYRFVQFFFIAQVAIAVLYYLSSNNLFGTLWVRSRSLWMRVRPPRAVSVIQTKIVMPNSAPPIRVDAMAVREWNDGRVTLIVRERSHRKCATGHLLIWSSKNNRRIQDSQYDLGQITLEGDGLPESRIEEFLELAQQRLLALGTQGAETKAKRKRKKGGSDVAVQAAAVTASVAELPAAAIAPAEAETPPGETALAEPAATRCRYPSVSRGTILKIGMMPRTGGSGEEIECFGVQLKTSEGIIDPVWGTHLRTTLREAGAGVGDRVEIVKVGRKVIEAGRAPMNLYSVTKLA